MALPSRVRILQTELPVGNTLLKTVTRLLADFGSDSAVLRLSGGSFSNFRYYLPALSDHPEHAVFFSEKIAEPETVELTMATITFGQKQGEPWLHCHAVWLEPDGKTLCGHLVPDEIVIANPIQVEVCLIESVRFDAMFDPETNFSIFKPVAVQDSLSSDWPPEETHDALVIRAIPNQDLCLTLEHLCAGQGWQKAQVQGGVGSLNCADFADGRHVEQLATELLIERGRIVPDVAGIARADIDITLVDFKGQVNRGRIARESNPVLVTCELVLVKQ